MRDKDMCRLLSSIYYLLRRIVAEQDLSLSGEVSEHLEVIKREVEALGGSVD